MTGSGVLQGDVRSGSLVLRGAVTETSVSVLDSLVNLGKGAFGIVSGIEQGGEYGPGDVSFTMLAAWPISVTSLSVSEIHQRLCQ